MKKTTFYDFEILSTLGQGAYSTVYLVKRKKDKKQYALKSVIMEKLSKIEQQNNLNEIRILSSIYNPNIISYKEAFWNSKNKTLNIIMEYCDDGDLETKINTMKRNKIKFDENLIWIYTIQILFGLKALHDKGVIHRDLKSANIFLSKLNSKCKIGDLNTGKILKNNNKNPINYQIGTPPYASPEVWKNQKISYKCDIWALGCIVYEMCTLRLPFKGKNMHELKENICKGKYEKISSRYSKELWDFIQTLLEVDIDKRPNCDMILESNIIKNKLKVLKELNYIVKEKYKINNDESSIMDTIEYKNLWDLENKIPNKKKYTQNNIIDTNVNMDLEETIKNESSFSQCSVLDFANYINEENDINTRKENINSYPIYKNIDKIKNNKIKNINKEILISNDFSTNNNNKSCKNLEYFNEKNKLCIEKPKKRNKSYNNNNNRANSNKINKYKNNIRIHIQIATTNKLVLKNLKNALTKKCSLQNSKKHLYLSNMSDLNIRKKKKDTPQLKSNKFNLYKTNQKNKNENNNKKIILTESKITTISKKGEIKQCNYTNYKNYKSEKYSKLYINNKTNASSNCDTNLKRSINSKENIRTIPTKKIELSFNNIYNLKSKNKAFTNDLFIKKQRTSNNTNKMTDKKLNSLHKNKTKKIAVEKNISNKLNKKNPSLSIKLFEIDRDKSNSIKLTKSLIGINPFYKKYNNTFVSDMSKKIKNCIKNNINISSKLINIKKNSTNVY